MNALHGISRIIGKIRNYGRKNMFCTLHNAGQFQPQWVFRCHLVAQALPKETQGLLVFG